MVWSLVRILYFNRCDISRRHISVSGIRRDVPSGERGAIPDGSLLTFAEISFWVSAARLTVPMLLVPILVGNGGNRKCEGASPDLVSMPLVI